MDTLIIKHELCFPRHRHRHRNSPSRSDRDCRRTTQAAEPHDALPARRYPCPCPPRDFICIILRHLHAMSSRSPRCWLQTPTRNVSFTWSSPDPKRGGVMRDFHQEHSQTTKRASSHVSHSSQTCSFTMHTLNSWLHVNNPHGYPHIPHAAPHGNIMVHPRQIWIYCVDLHVAYMHANSGCVGLSCLFGRVKRTNIR
jgi:hypothetical protein